MADLKNLRKMLESRGRFNVSFEEATPDEPINSEDATYIKKRLGEMIFKSDVVLGIAGLYASHSDWMAWELKTADDIGVPIIGVTPRGQERISKVVRIKAKEIVGWNADSVVDAIRRWV